MRIAVMGATSKTGHHVLAEGLAHGHSMVAFGRRPDALPDPTGLAKVVIGDGRDGAAVGDAVSGADAVISLVSGGSRRDRRQATEVTRTITAAMRAHGVRRLVVTSAYPIVAREPRVPIWLLRRMFATAYADVATMERELMGGELDWTIVRLNRLTDAPAGGSPLVSRGLLRYARPLSRADAADVLLDAATDGAAVRVALNAGGA